MIAQEYVPLAGRTLKQLPTFRQHMIHMGLGIAGEMGELIDAVKKVLVYGKEYDHTNAMEEVGDTLWYVANLLPALNVDAHYLQRALDTGHVSGTRLQQTHHLWQDFFLGEALLDLNRSTADRCGELARLDPAKVPGTALSVQYVEVFGTSIGLLCGLLGVDSSMAMQRNIEKLAKRYGEMYSDVAALNRDLNGERKALEGSPQ